MSHIVGHIPSNHSCLNTSQIYLTIVIWPHINLICPPWPLSLSRLVRHVPSVDLLIIHMHLRNPTLCRWSCPSWQRLLEIHSHLRPLLPQQWRRRGEDERRQRLYRRKLMALQVPRRRRQQHLSSRRRTILMNCRTLKKLRSISAKPPLRILCHHWSPTHGEILFAQLGMRFRSHLLMFIFHWLMVMTLFG